MTHFLTVTPTFTDKAIQGPDGKPVEFFLMATIQYIHDCRRQVEASRAERLGRIQVQGESNA